MAWARKTAERLAGLLGPVLLWEVARRSGLLSPASPTPGGVVAAAQRTLADGTLLAALAQSLQRVLGGVAIGAAIGVPLGLVIGASRTVERALGPFVNSLRSIAPIAWIPMAILWFGLSGQAALFIVSYAATFPFIVSAAQAVRLMDGSAVKAAKVLGAGSLRMTVDVLFPAALPTILVGARIAMGFAWGSIIAAELAMGVKLSLDASAQTAGIGQLMSSTLFVRRDVDALVLYMIAIGVVGITVDAGLRALRARMCPWAL